MEKLIIPEGYKSPLDIRETEIAIKYVKDYFERELANQLNLTRVSAPLFVEPESGLNDTLNGVERPVSFGIKETGGPGGGDRPLSCQVEALCFKTLRLPSRRRTLHRYERYPQG